MQNNRVAIIAGGRTPFVGSGKAYKHLGPLALATHAVRSLIHKTDLDPHTVEAITFGAVVPERDKPNLAREIVFRAGMPHSIEAQTVSSYCISGLRAITSIADAIATGRIEIGVAGGVEWLSGADHTTFKEPTTDLLMGEHQEITTREWEIPRSRQDELSLASHENAITASHHLACEIFPFMGVEMDTGPRNDSTLAALSNLSPVFDPEGTLTAGNSSPVTDGASAVILMSEKRARSEHREPLAYIRAMEYGAVDPSEGLLMAPAVTVPRLLERTQTTLAEIDLIEIHEAFAAQVLANVYAWERGWKGRATGAIDWDKVNVNGGSIALGHPWSATGGRIVTTLANEMARRSAKRGLLSICAAGGMAGAFLLERE
jgi:acetyl-CoA acetyltransferase family protein